MARNHMRWQVGALSTDADLRALTPYEKLAYWFVNQDTYLTPAGTITMCPESWAEDIGITTAELNTAFTGLAKKRFVVIDRKTHELLVRTFIHWDGIADQPNMLKQTLAAARRVKSADLRRALAAELRRLPPAPAPKQLKGDRVMVYPDPHACADEIEVPGPVPPNPSGKATGKTSENPSEKGVQTAFPEPQGEGEGEGEGVPSRSNPVGEQTTTPRKRGHRLPDNWDVTHELVAWVRDRCPDIDARFHTEKFKNHWHSSSGRNAAKLDWDKAWKNWMLDEQAKAEQRRQPGQHLRSVPSWQPTFADPEAALAELRERAAGDGPTAVGREVGKLIHVVFLPEGRTPGDHVSELEWNRRQVRAFIDKHEDQIRAALIARQAG